MCGVWAQAIQQAVGTGANANAAYYETKASNDAYEWNARMMRRNRDIALSQEREAIQLGQEDAAAYRGQVQQVLGQISSRAAAAGVGPGGSVADAITTTTIAGEVGMQKIQRNAAREAWAARVEAANYQTASSLELAKRRSPGMAFGTTLIGGAGPTAKASYSALASRADSGRYGEAPSLSKYQVPSGGYWTDVPRKAW